MTSSALSRRGLIKASLLGATATGLSTVAAATQAKPKEKKQVFDVVIIGAGCAGLSAAIEAADRGAKVAVLEKMGMPFGNTIYAGGIFNATNTYVQKEQGLTDTVEAFYEDMMKVSQGRGDPVLTKVYCEESASAIQWLSDRVHIRFGKIVKEVWPGLVRGHVVQGPTKPGGSQLVKQLLAEIEKLPSVKIFYETKAMELTHSPTWECTGVKALSKEEGPIEFVARGGVLITTGGFHANKEMVCKYMGNGIDWMPLRGSPYLMGENVQLTAPFHPYYLNMDQFHGGPIHGPTKANPSTLVNYGIIVNKQGNRIIDEVNTYVAIAKTLPKLTPDNWAYIIIDSEVLNISTVATRLDRYRRAKAPVYEGNSIADLAAKIHVDPKVLEKTVGDYNAAVEKGEAAQLTPPNTLAQPRKLLKSPFLALPFQGGMTATFGGPKISVKGEVLGAEQEPIPGLYAAGNAIGGLFYYDYIVGSQLTAAVIFGRHAADEAAKRAKSGKKA